RRGNLPGGDPGLYRAAGPQGEAQHAQAGLNAPPLGVRSPWGSEDPLVGRSKVPGAPMALPVVLQWRSHLSPFLLLFALPWHRVGAPLALRTALHWRSVRRSIGAPRLSTDTLPFPLFPLYFNGRTRPLRP